MLENKIIFRKFSSNRNNLTQKKKETKIRQKCIIKCMGSKLVTSFFDENGRELTSPTNVSNFFLIFFCDKIYKKTLAREISSLNLSPQYLLRYIID